MRFFSVDSPLYKFISRFWDVLRLNFLWIVFSLPIVTIGAATVAVFSVTLKMSENSEGYIVKQFVQAFKENLKQGIFLGLMLLALCYLAYLNMEFFNKIENNPIYFLFAAIIIMLAGMIYFTYAFAICARYENTIINILKNSAAISMKYFGRTVLLWIVIALLVMLFMFNSTLMFFGILIGPASVFFTISGFAISFFKEIDGEKNE